MGTHIVSGDMHRSVAQSPFVCGNKKLMCLLKDRPDRHHERQRITVSVRKNSQRFARELQSEEAARFDP